MKIVTGFPLNWKVRDLIGQGILLMVREKKICIVQIVYFVEKMKMHIQCMLRQNADGKSGNFIFEIEWEPCLLIHYLLPTLQYLLHITLCSNLPVKCAVAAVTWHIILAHQCRFVPLN